MGLKDRISVNPNVRLGKPCVAGTRIAVQDVIDLVRAGILFDEIVRDYYPGLQIDDIRACIEYAVDVMGMGDILLQ